LATHKELRLNMRVREINESKVCTGLEEKLVTPLRIEEEWEEGLNHGI